MIKPIRGIVIWVRPEENMARVVELKGNRKVYIPLSAQRPPFIQNHKALFRSFWPASELPLPSKGDYVLFEEATNVVYAQPTALVWCFQRDAFLAIHQFEMSFRVICPECPHTMGDHNEFGECQKCNCGAWEEPDDYYMHGLNAHPMELSDQAPIDESCPLCLHPVIYHTPDGCELCECGHRPDPTNYTCPNCGAFMNGNEVVQECPKCGYGTEAWDHRNDPCWPDPFLAEALKPYRKEAKND